MNPSGTAPRPPPGTPTHHPRPPPVRRASSDLPARVARSGRAQHSLHATATPRELSPSSRSMVARQHSQDLAPSWALTRELHSSSQVSLTSSSGSMGEGRIGSPSPMTRSTAMLTVPLHNREPSSTSPPSGVSPLLLASFASLSTDTLQRAARTASRLDSADLEPALSRTTSLSSQVSPASHFSDLSDGVHRLGRNPLSSSSSSLATASMVAVPHPPEHKTRAWHNTSDTRPEVFQPVQPTATTSLQPIRFHAPNSPLRSAPRSPEPAVRFPRLSPITGEKKQDSVIHQDGDDDISEDGMLLGVVHVYDFDS
jgi:hypothetical protein